MADKTATKHRFKVPVQRCDVSQKMQLHEYRKKWVEWMSWYELSDSEPNSIESQIFKMLFHDITYRAAVGVRASLDSKMAVSARSATLAYLLDEGYVVAQVLYLDRLLDDRADVISVKRLLKDIEKNRGLITREIYVSGDGLPYDYEKWTATADRSDPLVQIYGIDAPGFVRFAMSKDRHEKFDLLSRTPPYGRKRSDVIPKSVFKVLDGWISGPLSREIGSIRNNFVAHSADALRRGRPGSAQFRVVKFTQIDQLQRAIIRVERALTDYILPIHAAREVVPSRPLGIFSGLDLPYCPSTAIDAMHRVWDELSSERNSWTNGILDELTSALPGLPATQTPNP